MRFNIFSFRRSCSKSQPAYTVSLLSKSLNFLGTYNFLVELVTHRVELLELLNDLIFDPNQLGSFRMATSIPHDECLVLLPQYHLKYPRKVFLRLHKCQTLGDEFLQRHKHSQLVVFFTRHCAQLGAHTSNLVHTSSTRKEKGLFG